MDFKAFKTIETPVKEKIEKVRLPRKPKKIEKLEDTIELAKSNTKYDFLIVVKEMEGFGMAGRIKITVTNTKENYVVGSSFGTQKNKMKILKAFAKTYRKQGPLKVIDATENGDNNDKGTN